MGSQSTRESGSHTHIVHVLALRAKTSEHLPASLPQVSALRELLKENEEFARAQRNGDLLAIPAENGFACICYRDPIDAVRVALSTASLAITHPHLKCSMGIHSGEIHPLGWIDPASTLAPDARSARIREVESSIGWLQANSRVLRAASRLGELGDAGHLLVSETTAAYLHSRTDWRGSLRDLGERELEPGFVLRVFNLYSDRVGNPDSPVRWQRLPLPPDKRSPLTVVILFKARSGFDQQVAFALETELGRLGYDVFLDRRLASGVAWAQGLDQKIRNSDAVITLISAQSAQSEMFAYEVELAHLAGQQQHGFPRIWPVRLGEATLLPEPLQTMLAPLEYRWDSENELHHVDRLLCPNESGIPELASVLAGRLRSLAHERAELLEARQAAIQKAASKPVPRAPLEPAGGAVPLESAFYIVRQTDEEFRQALARNDSIILIKGARQMGKTSLLGRGLQLARQSGAQVILTDFQKLHGPDLRSIESFFRALREMVADQLRLDEKQLQPWDEKRNPNSNFERFWRQDILEPAKGAVAWGCDEFDRLFSTNFGSEVCGLFRSWHNERVLDAGSPWCRLTLAIAYATEAHLFIRDLNQSPFNVGTRLSLTDFTLEQVAELNRRYGGPLRGAAEIERFYQLVAGHPFLVRRALQEMVSQELTLPALEVQATDEEGIFSDHLRRMLVSLSHETELRDAMARILQGQGAPNPTAFYRLRSAGLLAGNSPSDARVRCQLYETYLKRHLLP